jgi:hypothetical protein
MAFMGAVVAVGEAGLLLLVMEPSASGGGGG